MTLLNVELGLELKTARKRNEVLERNLKDAEEAGKRMAKQLIQVERERDALAAKLAELEGQEPVAWVEVVSTHEGPYNFKGVALLGKGNHLLYARPVPAESHHKHAAPWLGWALHIIRERCPDVVTSHQFERAEDTKKACFAEGLDQVPAEQPVNARLLEALSALLADIEALIGESVGVYGLHLNGDVSPWSELEEGGRFERLSSMSSARDAITSAESAPKAVRLTDAEVTSLLADSDANSSRVQSFFMVEPHKFARAIEAAALRKNGLEVAE